jgi:iron complex transport system substrate-binding protein
MNINDVSGQVVDAALSVHRELGPGLLESVYEVVLADELSRRGLRVRRQVPIPIRFGGREFEEGYRADLLVEEAIIVEIKSVEQLARVHKKQVLTYLKLSGMPLGFLINFSGEFPKGNMERLVYNLPREQSLSAASAHSARNKP